MQEQRYKLSSAAVKQACRTAGVPLELEMNGSIIATFDGFVMQAVLTLEYQGITLSAVWNQDTDNLMQRCVALAKDIEEQVKHNE